MPNLTENQIEYLKANREDFESVPAEKQEDLLKKSATRWFKEMADYYSRKSDTPSEDEQEKLDELIGTGIFFAYQFKMNGKKDYLETVRECLTEYTEWESTDINEAIENYNTLTAVEEEAPEQEAPEQEAPEQEAPMADDRKARPRPSTPQTGENSLLEIKLFDYFRAKNHFEKRNPVSRFFSKLAGKIFHTGEYYALSVKENHLQNEYGIAPLVLESRYRDLNRKNTFDGFATEEVDYSSMSATDKEVNEFKEKLIQDLTEANPEQTSKPAEAPQPQKTREL